MECFARHKLNFYTQINVFSEKKLALYVCIDPFSKISTYLKQFLYDLHMETIIFFSALNWCCHNVTELIF